MGTEHEGERVYVKRGAGMDVDACAARTIGAMNQAQPILDEPPTMVSGRGFSYDLALTVAAIAPRPAIPASAMPSSDGRWGGNPPSAGADRGDNLPSGGKVGGPLGSTSSSQSSTIRDGEDRQSRQGVR